MSKPLAGLALTRKREMPIVKSDGYRLQEVKMDGLSKTAKAKSGRDVVLNEA
jgi:hypothetical protein